MDEAQAIKENRISALKAMLHDNTLVVLAHEIQSALSFIASGRIEPARKCLENALSYAQKSAAENK